VVVTVSRFYRDAIITVMNCADRAFKQLRTACFFRQTDPGFNC
jgi:hypothetical protein